MVVTLADAKPEALFLTAQEAARIAGISPKALYRHLDRGTILGFDKANSGRKPGRFVQLDSFLVWLDARPAKAEVSDVG